MTSLVWLCLLFAVSTVELTRAASQIEDDTACASCVGGGSVVCRPNYYDRYSFCCDETEIGSRSCGGTDVFCTTMAQNSLMNAFACPYSYGYCGAKTSEINMHPTKRNNIAIEISNRLYIDAETCYYQFSVPTSDLDTDKMRYFWDVNIDEMTNVVTTINNGTSLLTANDPITVGFTTGYRFQFTAENNVVFMAFTGSVPSTSSNSPLFSMSIKLRSFELNPSSGTDEVDDGEDTDTGETGGTTDPVVDPLVDPIDIPIIEPDKPIIPDTGEVDEETEPEIVTETEIVTVKRMVPNSNTIGEKSKN